MTCSRLDNLKGSIDRALQNVSFLNTKNVIVYKTTNTVTEYDKYGTPIGTTETYLTVGDGYSAIDGYYNPTVEFVSAQDIFLSGGKLTNNDIKVGPFVYPYTACDGTIKGLNPAIIDPTPVDNQTFDLIFKVVGTTFPEKYYKRKYIEYDGGVSYILYLTATGFSTHV